MRRRGTQCCWGLSCRYGTVPNPAGTAVAVTESVREGEEGEREHGNSSVSPLIIAYSPFASSRVLPGFYLGCLLLEWRARVRGLLWSYRAVPLITVLSRVRVCGCLVGKCFACSFSPVRCFFSSSFLFGQISCFLSGYLLFQPLFSTHHTFRQGGRASNRRVWQRLSACTRTRQRFVGSYPAFGLVYARLAECNHV